MRRLVLFLSLLVSGCNFYIPERPTGAPTFSVDGVDIYNDSKTLNLQNFNARIDVILRTSLLYWDGDNNILSGLSIHIIDSDVKCGLRTNSQGCTNPIDRVIEVTTEESNGDADNQIGNCIERLAIPHEIGHLILDDPTHMSFGFRQMGGLYREIVSKSYIRDTDCAWQNTDLSYFGQWDSQVGF